MARRRTDRRRRHGLCAGALVSRLGGGEKVRLWRRLRRESPVFWIEGTPEFPGFWCITKYDDVMTVSRWERGTLRPSAASLAEIERLKAEAVRKGVVLQG